MAQQVKTFRITDQPSEEAINVFLRGKRAHHWSASYADNGWNILLVYEAEKQNRHNNHERHERHERQEPHPPKKSENPGPEHVVDLPAEQMPLYDAIRRWRNTKAREENIKPYILFNNKQLEDIIKSRPADVDTLKPMLPDMKPDHFEKYSGELIGMVNAT